MATQKPGSSEKTLSKVVKQLETVNTALAEQIARADVSLSFENDAGIVGKIARSRAAQREKDAQKEVEEHTRQFDEIISMTTETENRVTDTGEATVGELEDVRDKLLDHTELAKAVAAHTVPIATLVDQGEAQIEAAEDAAAIAAEAAREAARKGDQEQELAVTLELPEEEEGGIFGTIVAAISGALLGSVAGLAIGFVNMWKDIFKFLGKSFTKMFPNVSKMLGDIFGKGGKISKFFTSMKLFFTESKAFQVMDDLITKGKAAITKVMKPIKATFTAMKTGWTSMITKIKSWIKLITDPIDDLKKLLGLGGEAGKTVKSTSKFMRIFKGFFSGFSKIFAKIMWPLQIIISLFEGGAEAADAVDKSTSLPASIFNAIIGFVGGVLDGLVFGMLDLIKGAISWIAGFLGFKDVEATLDSFSFSEMWNEFLDDIYEWFNLLFEDPVGALTNLLAGFFGAHLAIGDFIVDMLKKPLVWIMELFGWDDAAAATEAFSLSGFVMEKWDKVVAWVTGLFAWFKTAGATEEGGWSLATFIDDAWLKVKEWIMGLFSWAKEVPGVSWIVTTIDTVVSTVKGWFTGLFSWASEEDESDSWVIKTIKGIVTTVKEWFGSMFQFDSASGVLKTVLNIMMWIPNLFVKAVAGITAWFAGLLGFKEEAKEIAEAGKEFNIGDLIFKAVDAIVAWFGDLFDKIMNFDFGALAKSIMPAKLYDWIFGGVEPTETAKESVAKAEEGFDEDKAEKARKELVSAGLLDEDALSKDNLEIAKIQEALASATGNSRKALISALTKQLGDTDIAEDDRQELATLIEKEKGKLSGKAIESTLKTKTKPAVMASQKLPPADMAMHDGEKGTWNQVGNDWIFYSDRNVQERQQGGLVTETGLAMLHGTIPKPELILDNQAASLFMEAALVLKGIGLGSGMELMNLQRDKATAGGMAATMIVNNTNSQQNIQSQAMVLPPSPIMAGNGESTLSTA